MENTYQKPQVSPLARIGRALSGISAPYVGDMQWAVKQQQLQQQADQADQEFQRYMMQMQMKSSEPTFEEILQKYGDNLPEGTTYNKNGLTVPLKPKETDTAQRARVSRESLSTNIDKLRNLFDTIPSAEGFKGRLVGANEALKGMLGYNPNLTTYKDFSDVILGQIATTIGGESGSRLSDQDILRMQKAFPNEWKTTSERKKKWDLFESTADDVATAYGAKPIFKQTKQTQKDKTQQLNSGTNNELPAYDPKTQKLQQNKRTGEYRVVPLR